MNTPKISIILPIYDVEAYLRECLESILTQSFKEIEVISVIKQKEGDGSLCILEEYAATDERIKIVLQKKK